MGQVAKTKPRSWLVPATVICSGPGSQNPVQAIETLPYRASARSAMTELLDAHAQQHEGDRPSDRLPWGHPPEPLSADVKAVSGSSDLPTRISAAARPTLRRSPVRKGTKPTRNASAGSPPSNASCATPPTWMITIPSAHASSTRTHPRSRDAVCTKYRARQDPVMRPRPETRADSRRWDRAEPRPDPPAAKTGRPRCRARYRGPGRRARLPHREVHRPPARPVAEASSVPGLNGTGTTTWAESATTSAPSPTATTRRATTERLAAAADAGQLQDSSHPLHAEGNRIATAEAKGSETGAATSILQRIQ